MRTHNMRKLDDYKMSPIDELILSSQQVTASYEELAEAAIEMALFIDRTGRVPLNIEEFRVAYDRNFQPDCWYSNLAGDNITDTDYSSRDSRVLTDKEKDDLSKSKTMCAGCPLKRECLAVGLATAKDTRRKSKNKPPIPGTEESGQPVYMNEFCIYGGYSPGERLIMYNMIVYMLGED